MKKSFIIKTIIPVICVATIASSCSDDQTEQPNPDREIVINNDASSLDGRMTEKDEVINIIPTANSGRSASDISLRLRGELAPPVVDGKTLQATSIAERKDYFVVSYNFRGSEYGGAIDLLNSNLRLKSQILFSDADISDVAFSGDDLYFVGASSSLSEPAFVERIGIRTSSETFTLDKQTRNSLGFYVANSVTTSGNNVYVTTGNDDSRGGGLYKLDKSLNQQSYKKKKDARWADAYGDKIFSITGIDGSITVWNRNDMSKVRSFKHNGSIGEESKMTIDVDKNMVFVAGGREGLLVYDLDGNFITKYTFGSNVVTNAVTANRGKVFISNGEAGIFVASYDPFLELIGKLDLEENESVNHIVLNDNYLYLTSIILTPPRPEATYK
ncbi:MAG: hypothetical protein AAFY41_10205, partial [Bacteroidota bacterium]